jgi:hypothetical protein
MRGNELFQEKANKKGRRSADFVAGQVAGVLLLKPLQCLALTSVAEDDRANDDHEDDEHSEERDERGDDLHASTIRVPRDCGTGAAAAVTAA